MSGWTPFEKRRRAESAGAWVGVDAGKFEHTLVVRVRGAADGKPFAFTTTRAGFDAALAHVRKATGPLPASAVLIGIEFAGSYGFTLAHYLHGAGYEIVSVLPAHTKHQKEITHNQALKTDAKDAAVITELVARGAFVSFPFLHTPYADLRYLVSARESLTVLRTAAVTRLRSLLDVVFPEFESVFVGVASPTALAILAAFPGPAAILAAPRRSVCRLLALKSRNHGVAERYAALVEAARTTLALPGAQGALRDELPLIVTRIELFQAQLATIKARMIATMADLPEVEYLLTIPGVAPISAATFLGAVGDVRAYQSADQILRLAGLSLVERSSGRHKGQPRLSKRGRPVLRRHAFMLALRSVRGPHGLYRADYERLLRNNGGKKLSALTAISRKTLRLMFRIASARRAFVPTLASEAPHA